MKRKLAEWLNTIFGFRKFLLMLIVIAIAVIFRTHSYIDGAQMVDLLKATVLGFFGANGVEYAMTVVKGAMDAKNKPVETIQGPADTDESNDDEDVK